MVLQTFWTTCPLLSSFWHSCPFSSFSLQFPPLALPLLRPLLSIVSSTEITRILSVFTIFNQEICLKANLPLPVQKVLGRVCLLTWYESYWKMMQVPLQNSSPHSSHTLGPVSLSFTSSSSSSSSFLATQEDVP